MATYTLNAQMFEQLIQGNYDDLRRELNSTDYDTFCIGGSVVLNSNAYHISKALQGTGIITVDLSWCRMSTKDAQEFAQYLPKTNIRNLGLACNSIGLGDPTELMRLISNSKVKTINLSTNAFGPYNSQKVVHQLKQSEVEELNMSGNHIPTDHTKAFAESFIGCNISKLNVENCSINCQIFRQSVPNTNLVLIQFDGFILDTRQRGLTFKDPKQGNNALTIAQRHFEMMQYNLRMKSPDSITSVNLTSEEYSDSNLQGGTRYQNS